MTYMRTKRILYHILFYIIALSVAGIIQSCQSDARNNTRMPPVIKKSKGQWEKDDRPTEVELLIGDPAKSNEKLGWKPKHTLDSLIEDMATSDLRLFQKDQLLLKEGFGVLNYFE